MPDLRELLAQKAALDRQIEETQRAQRASAIEQIRSLMAEYQLSAADLKIGRGSRSKADAPSKSSSKVAPKYRNAETGETWSGRGLQPRWLKAALAQGRKIDDFAV